MRLRRSLASIFMIAFFSAMSLPISSPQAQGSDGDGNKNPQTSAPTISESNLKILETCFKCHGPGGVSQIPTHPTIAGQKVGYLVNQLSAFKRSQDAIAASTPKSSQTDNEPNIIKRGRGDSIMSHMVKSLGKKNIVPLAIYISVLPCDGNIKSGDIKTRLNVPKVANRCIVCHGKNGISLAPNIPNLAGQKRAYLRRELLLMRETAWGGGTSTKKEWRNHPIMEQQAARLRIEDVDSISSYYAQLNCSGKN